MFIKAERITPLRCGKASALCSHTDLRFNLEDQDTAGQAGSHSRAIAVISVGDCSKPSENG